MNTEDFCKKYYVNRKNTNAIKWDIPEVKDKLPMFIADMDFKCDQRVIDALASKIQYGSFGYTFLPKDYFDVLNLWNKKRNGLTYKKDWIRFSKGAVDAIYQVLYSLTKPKDAILITTPVYPPFAGSINQTGRKLVKSPLIRKDGLYTFDYQDLEKKFKTKKVKMMILCSPHNPIGRVWTKEELTKLFELTHKYHVLVISDEVHSDLIMPGNKFIPSLKFKAYQDEIITLTALSKTISIAIFSHCHVIIPNAELRAKFDIYQKLYHLAPVNAYNALATYYGYQYSNNWLDDVIKVINENYEYIKDRLGKYLFIEKLEGTYLLFVDFSKYTKNAYKFLYNKCGIVPNAGETFADGFESWARLNIATSKANIKKACDQIEKAILKK